MAESEPSTECPGMPRGRASELRRRALLACPAYRQGEPSPHPKVKAKPDSTPKAMKRRLDERCEALGGVARAAIRLGKKEEARRLGLEAVEASRRLGPSCKARAWLALGEVEHRSGEYAEAIKAHAKARPPSLKPNPHPGPQTSWAGRRRISLARPGREARRSKPFSCSAVRNTS